PAARSSRKRIAAHGARSRRDAALCELLPRRARRPRRGQPEGARREVRRATAGEEGCLRRGAPPESAGRLERAAFALLLLRVARRRGRRFLRNRRWLRAARHSLHAAHRSAQEVVAMANEKVDVVIVGGGASGLLLAATLAHARQHL